ncbi:MAG: PQQ-binding-like beta-propeller repeat protein [Anaerolineales bacterium]|jgi:outer membrane protein assembly factor BamB
MIIKKSILFWFTIPIILVLLIITVIGGAYLWYYFNHFIYPIQPKAEEAFPEKPHWIYRAEGRIISTPVVQDSLVFLRTPINLIAIDSSTRDRKWIAKSNAPTGIHAADLTLAPQIGSGLLISPQAGSSLIALSLETGESVWDIPPEEENLKDSSLATIQSFQIEGNKVFVARYSWSLSAYSLQDGNLLWESDQVPDRATLFLVANSNCVFLGAVHNLQCFDPGSGKLLWKKTFDGVIDALQLDERLLFIALQSGNESLMAVDLNTLNTKWDLSPDEISGDKIRSMLSTEETLFAGGNHLYAISVLDGSIIWKSDEIGPLETPVILDTNIFVRNTGRDLFRLDINSGKQVGRLEVRADSSMNDPDRSPAVIDGLLFVPFGDNRLLVYQFLGSQ